MMNILKYQRINQLDKVKDIVEDLPMGNNIPKVVHHTYPTRDLNPDLKANLDNLKKQNPDWEFRFYDDADQISFINANFPELSKYYYAINSDYGAAKADLFRYLLIYKYGGVYLDIKSTLSRPLNSIVMDDTKFILAYWELASDGYHPEIEDENGEFEQWHVISVSGHPFLKSVINNICRNIAVYNPFLDGRGAIATLKVTGPIAYSLAIAPLVKLWPHTIGKDSDFGLIYSIFNHNQATKLSHRNIFKSHYTRSLYPVVRQAWYVEYTYMFLCRVAGKLDRTWKKLINK